jgi:hypothetical protein
MPETALDWCEVSLLTKWEKRCFAPSESTLMLCTFRLYSETEFGNDQILRRTQYYHNMLWHVGKGKLNKIIWRYWSLEKDETWSNYWDIAGRYWMSHQYHLGYYFWWYGASSHSMAASSGSSGFRSSPRHAASGNDACIVSSPQHGHRNGLWWRGIRSSPPSFSLDIIVATKDHVMVHQN